MKEKTSVKKRAALLGCLIFCIAAVIIGIKLADPAKEGGLPQEEAIYGADVTQEPDLSIETEDAYDVAEKTQENAGQVSVSDGEGAVSGGVNQSIQPDVTKPAEPSEQAKKDPSKAPDEKKTADAKSPAQQSQPKPDAQQNQQKSETKTKGKIYVEGFGWIDDIGEGKGKIVHGDGDINKQVGEM